MERVADPQPSPRGDRVAFTLRVSDFAANRGKTDLWIVNLDGSGLLRLTGDGGASNPRWSPDGGSLYFLYGKSGSTQVWRFSPAPAASAASGAAGASGPPRTFGAQPVQVTSLPLDVSSFIVSRDGQRLALSMDVFPDCSSPACTAERIAARDKSPVKARLYPDGGGFVRHWDAWADGRRSHLFVLPLSSGVAGQPVDVMRGMVADAPSKPFGGTEEYTFSPDGRTLVFAARDAGRQEPWSTNFDLYQAPVDGSRPPQDLTAANLAWDTYPVFSPDGRTLAYAAMTRPGFEADRFHIVVRDLASGRERTVAASWDRSAGPLLFSADGRTLYTTTEDLGQALLFAIDVASGEVRKVVAQGHVEAPALAGDRLVFTLDHFRSPAEIYSVRPDGSDLRPVTAINRGRLASLQLGEPEQFRFSGANGDTVYGWVFKPADFVPGMKYPVAFLIHGGPQGSFDNHFHYRWNPQVYAGAGYGVVMVDFHGSTGYGQAFTDAIRNDWGGKPLVDLQKGLAAALARYPWLDGDRTCALGASYGGFMIYWIAGNWPDRFRCLVSHDGVFDQRMAYYATEELWFPEWEHGGPYWQNPEAYERDNPARFVERWRAPMLVVHGSHDYRLPETQGLAAFTVLQRKGIPSELLSFPDENHWVQKPANSVLWHRTVLDWLDRWLKGAP